MIMPLSSSANALTARLTLLALEQRTARLTILIDPRKKAFFERLCAEEDATPSQVVRRLVRNYIEERTGGPWTPDDPKPGTIVIAKNSTPDDPQETHRPRAARAGRRD